jgi:hypothetical protein
MNSQGYFLLGRNATGHGSWMPLPDMKITAFIVFCTCSVGPRYPMVTNKWGEETESPSLIFPYQARSIQTQTTTSTTLFCPTIFSFNATLDIDVDETKKINGTKKISGSFTRFWTGTRRPSSQERIQLEPQDFSKERVISISFTPSDGFSVAHGNWTAIMCKKF